MTEEQQKKELEIALTSYIALKHNQDECIGFIDGFKEALSLFAVSRECLHPFNYVNRDKITEMCKCSVCGEKWY